MNDKQMEHPLSRREVLRYLAALSVSAAVPVGLSGCASDPVTGKKQLMMVSRDQEIGIDRQQSPFQFSSDYGVVQDSGLNAYISGVGRSLVPYVHRPDMPYNFQCVNATYVNAYAFPGGSIAVTRGILLKLDNEAQLASLLGHELGHVNARHSAEQMSKGQISNLLVQGLAAVAGTQSAGLGQITQQLGMIGQGLLLSSYSRDNEREADALGNEYMVKAGYSSRGFVQLMEMLNSMHSENQSYASILFSTHPMSSERLDSAVQRLNSVYASSADHYRLRQEKFMDRTASLRKQKKGIELLQQGEKSLGSKDYENAQTAFKSAVSELKTDYTAHVLLAKCFYLMDKPMGALEQADTAVKLYPGEAQGHYMAGLAANRLRKYTQAYQSFETCDKLLPGNPQVRFYKGYCLDQQGNTRPAAENYMAYLEMINYQSNQYSQYAYGRLKQWGYTK